MYCYLLRNSQSQSENARTVKTVKQKKLEDS